MRDKLIELLMTQCECNKDGHGECSMCEYKYCDEACERHITEIIADFLLANGVIVLPCKVGDTMFVEYEGCRYPVKVNAIRIDTKKNNHRLCVSGTFHLKEYYDHHYQATFPFDSIGKSLFYTEAEAIKGGERE